jgi:formylglycine-generating enzyme required for sulfatase activity
MVVIPAGKFVMGSPSAEPDRSGTEGPQRTVAVRKLFAMSRFEVTRNQFAAFVRETGYQSAGCRLWSEVDQWRVEWTRDWRDPGFAQTDTHPVSCINWYDARAYADWLSKRSGRRYRLPSEAEWEYAARAGSEGARHWGEEADKGCAYANAADHSLKRNFASWTIALCDDGHVFTAPIGELQPNAFGLYDTLGSLWEWVEDCWNESYENAPDHQDPWLAGDCGFRVLRGGAWFTAPRLTRSASRFRDHRVHRFNFYGIRLAADL